MDFINHDLIGRLGISGISVGFDFHFGKGRTGSPALLAAEAPKLGIEVHIQSHIDVEGRAVSSTAIRNALGQGQLDEASALLGYPWFISGEVIHGEKRGRDLGYPTANIRLDPACGLRHGIYAVRIGRGTERFDGVASFGRRPTFDNGAPLLEVFLFDFKGDLYGTRLDIAFIAFLRDEVKFEGIEPLIRQMDDDSARAGAALAAAPEAFPPLGNVLRLAYPGKVDAGFPKGHAQSKDKAWLDFNPIALWCRFGPFRCPVRLLMSSRRTARRIISSISGPASA